MQIRSVGKSDVGRVREKNEDAFLVDEALGLFVVADGMGGHLGGRTASDLAVKTIAEVLTRHDAELDAVAASQPLEHVRVPPLLADAVRSACAAIYDMAQGDPELRGMGTTVTALVLRMGRAFIAHVGDSRCYLQRGDRVLQITDDHSLVNEQVKAGLLTLEAARTSRLKNIITRSVGFERDVAVDTFALPVHQDDRFLLCSDGLTNLVDDAEIGLALSSEPILSVPGILIDLACSRGGDDNVTVLCIQAEAP